MCGIWAILGYHGDTTVLLKDFKRVHARGPDCYRIENINHYRDCCLGFHRLAIVGDLDGMQPIRIKGKPHLWMLCNGEIYNYLMLIKEYNLQDDLNTHTDVECLLHLYEKLGAVDMCAQLDAEFAFILMDTQKRKVYLGRDTFGVRPLFYMTTADGFLGACSEMKGLIDVLPNVCQETVHLRPVPPGCTVEFDLLEDGHCRPKEVHVFHQMLSVPRYSSLTVADPNLDELANIRMLLNAAVKKRLMSERRIGCLLSGGLDSSLIAGLLVRNMREAGVPYPLQTFAIGMQDSVDVEAARKVAKFLGTEHHEVLFTPEEGIAAIPEVIHRIESYDITTVRASVGMYLVSKYISERTNTIVVFTGEGSDELCQGYIYFHKAPSSEEADKESRRLLHDLHYFDVLRCDRTVSGWGLEARVPFLDHQFCAYFLSIQPEKRQPKSGIEKWILRQAFQGENVIPEEILWRPKEAFSDGVSSKQKSWYQILQDTLDQEVTDEMMRIAPTLFPFNTPLTKEAFYYRRIFEKSYPNQSTSIPYFWMPKWIEGVTDPSARTLNNYKPSGV